MLLPVEKASASSSKSAAVRAGQYFVIVDVSVPGGKWVDDVLYMGTRDADKKADMYRKVREPSMWERYPYDAGLQVIDAVYFAPSEAKLRALGMRAAGSPKAAWTKGEEGRKQWETWFKEQPQEFQDKWNEMNELYGEVVKDQYKTAAGGMYGYTKSTQRDVEATVRKVTKYSTKLAKDIYAKDERSVDFLKTHAKRGSRTAKLLLVAMSNVGPRVASNFEIPIENKTAAKRKSPANGMYGFPSKVARLSLTACSDLKSYIGEVAYDLHSRRTARHSRITGFLKEHSKTANCGYSRMLLSCYPDAPVSKEANQKLPGELEENKWTDSDGDNPPPNPKGSDADGDGETNEPKPFKSAAKSSDFMPGDRVVYWVHGKGTVVDVWNEYGKTGITIEWDNGDVSNPMDRSRLMSDLQKLEGDLELVEGDVIELRNGDQGTVERVRDVDAWVAFPYGATWVPLKNIKKVVTKYRRRRSAATTIGSGKNGYIAMYKGKKVEVMADTKLEAQQVAAAHFKARKSYEVDVYLAEVDGKPYSHMPMFASEQEAEKMEAEADREKTDAARVVASMLRNAFVPDSVDGWLEWEDGTRTAATRRRG